MSVWFKLLATMMLLSAPCFQWRTEVDYCRKNNVAMGACLISFLFFMWVYL